MGVQNVATRRKYKYIKIVFIIGVFVWLSSWALHITTDLSSASSGPDEQLRMLIPDYIYEHHQLPTGYDQEAIYERGNWSYAFYPQMLGAIVSSIFMSLIGIFNTSTEALIFGARLSSVVFGTATVYVFGLIIRKLFDKRAHSEMYSYVAMIILAFWPQFSFLSSYINNDIVALFGVTLISYAVILGLRDKWNRTNSILLGFGFAVCLLGYTNSYGFVLVGTILFLITLLSQRSNLGTKKVVRSVLLVGIVPILIAGPFFVRNIVLYDGDVLGLATFKERTTEWERENNQRLQSTYTQATGGGLLSFAKDRKYWSLQRESFTGKFGYMTIEPRDGQLVAYGSLVGVGTLGLLLLCIRTLKNKELKRYKNEILFATFLIVGSVITFALSIYYTLKIDIQPQGRYIIYLLIPLLIAAVAGIRFLTSYVHSSVVRKIILGTIVLVYSVNSIIIFIEYIV